MRVHIYPDPPHPSEAARFIANALLLSYGVRTEAEAYVRVGDSWLRARGDRVRQLRPDEESLRGWMRAALRGGVGAELLKELPYRQAVCLSLEGEDLLSVLRRYPPVFSYGEGVECIARAKIPLPRPAMAVIVVNVLLDNLEIIGSRGLNKRDCEEGGATPRGEERLSPESYVRSLALEGSNR
ncbi:MAG: hypothetical protein N3F67_06025 [Acidilobaceae archaeon]|nr:hypothetical protein [Acidilobaceae archaeon]